MINSGNNHIARLSREGGYMADVTVPGDGAAPGAAASASPSTATTARSDVERLHELGYAQELLRKMGGFSNFAVSFTIISILSGCLTLYAFGMDAGGPVVMTIGWPLVGIMVILVGLAMAEVCSSYPTAGGLYYWAAKLGGKNSAAWSWFTGWFNLLGQVGVTIIFVVLFFVPAHHQSASFVFTKFVNNTGFGNGFYVFLIGLLLAQYTFTGYDASAHMTEETHNAAVAGPRGIVWSIIISLIAGWVLLIGVTGAIQDYDAERAAVVPAAQIFIDATGHNLGLFLLFIVVGAQFYCGMSSVTANSRMIYAFSRDGAIPGSKFWHKVNKRTRTPTNSIWLAAVAAFILGLPYLWSPVAYAAITSIAVIGLYVAYAIPVFLRLRAGESFQRGPWHLGRWSYAIGWITVVWVVFITLLFTLPQVTPIGVKTFNYASITTAVVLFGAGGWYLLSAKNWFHGPKVQGTPEELAAIERDLTIV